MFLTTFKLIFYFRKAKNHNCLTFFGNSIVGWPSQLSRGAPIFSQSSHEKACRVLAAASDLFSERLCACSVWKWQSFCYSKWKNARSWLRGFSISWTVRSNSHAALLFFVGRAANKLTVLIRRKVLVAGFGARTFKNEKFFSSNIFWKILSNLYSDGKHFWLYWAWQLISHFTHRV